MTNPADIDQESKPVRTIQRVDPGEVPPGYLIGRTKADALTFRVDDVRFDTPIYVVTVPTAWRLEVLVNGTEQHIDTTDQAWWHGAIGPILDEESQ